ncbi:MAG: zinc-finger domain-containing protein [Boseongicola sp.]
MSDTSEAGSAHPPPETETVTQARIACDGGGALGHPRVWLLIDPEHGWVECGYCDKRFVLAKGT